jgi:hypothetical protein
MRFGLLSDRRNLAQRDDPLAVHLGQFAVHRAHLRLFRALGLGQLLDEPPLIILQIRLAHDPARAAS